jgi:hypothetical protein
MWLRDFLPKDIQSLRILLYGYDSVQKDSTSTCSNQHYARQLLDAVNTIRCGDKEVYTGTHDDTKPCSPVNRGNTARLFSSDIVWVVL